MTLRTRWHTVAVASAVLVTVVACASGPSDGADDAREFAERIASAISDAEAGGASQNQLDILYEAQSAGYLTVDQARRATFADIDCIENAGGRASYVEQSDLSGLPVPNSILVAPNEEALAAMSSVAEECVKLESFWVNKVYQLQPLSQEVRDSYLEAQAPQIRACLEDHGYTVDASATPQDVLSQAILVAGETDDAVLCFD